MLPWVALWVAAYAQISDDEDLLKRRTRRNDEEIEGSAVEYMVDYDDLDTPAEDYAYEDIPESSADDSDEFDEVDNVLSQPVNQAGRNMKTEIEKEISELRDLGNKIENEMEDEIAKEPRLFIAITLGVCCLCCLTLIILLGCHRYKKKDEGSYDISYQAGEKKAFA